MKFKNCSIKDWTVSSGCEHLLHHIVIAATIACAVVIVESQGVLGWLDVLSLRVSQALPHVNYQEKNTVNDNAPIVFYIGDEMYENYFQQESPLDRSKLAEVIRKITRLHPKMIVLDFDLSPGITDIDEYSDNQNILDDLLDESANFCNLSTCIVLPTPISVKTKNLKEKQFKWMQERCLAGIEFALPDVILHQAISTSYLNGTPTLAEVTYSISFNKGHDETKEAHGEDITNAQGLCAYIKDHGSKEFDTYLTLLKASNENESRLYNIDYFRDLRAVNSNHKIELHSQSPIDSKYNNIANKIVFLGGDYGKDDKFQTVEGGFGGVFLHAAGLYSFLEPVERTSHLWAILIDVVIGVFLGYLFVCLWEKYSSCKHNYEEADGCFNVLKEYFIMRFWLIVNFTVMGLLLVIAYYASGYLLRSQMWLNPGPIIIGMFIHGLLCSRENENNCPSFICSLLCMHENKKILAENQIPISTVVKEHPDFLPLILFIIGTLIYVATHH